MTDRGGAEERYEVVVHVEYSGDTMTLTETDEGDFEPGAHPGEARVDVDPLVEAFARSPYDPVIGAMMMGRATGEVIADPPDVPWIRAIAAILAVGMIGQLPVTIYLLLRAEMAAAQLASPSFVVSGVFAVGGLILGWRLLRASGG